MEKIDKLVVSNGKVKVTVTENSAPISITHADDIDLSLNPQSG